MSPETERAARSALERARAAAARRGLETARRRHLTAGTSALPIEWHGDTEITATQTPRAKGASQ